MKRQGSPLRADKTLPGFDIDAALLTDQPSPVVPLLPFALKETQDLVKLSEFARERGVCRQTALNWIKSGRLPAAKNGSGYWMIPRSQIYNLPLTITEFAKRVRVHRITVHRWCRAGKLKAYQKGTGDRPRWEIDSTELVRLAPMAEARSFPRGVRLLGVVPVGSTPTLLRSANGLPAGQPTPPVSSLPPSREEAESPGKSSPAKRTRKPRADEEFAGPARTTKRTTRTKIPPKRKDQR